MNNNVFPESMTKLDVSNDEKSLSTIEEYIAYMAERIDFYLKSKDKIYKSNLATLGEEVVSVSASVTALDSNIADINENVQKVADDVTKAVASVDGKNTIFYGTEQPDIASAGDIWIDSNSKTMYVFAYDNATQTTKWIDAQDQKISDLTDSVDRLQTENSEQAQAIIAINSWIEQNPDNVKIAVESSVGVVRGELEEYKAVQGTYLKVEELGVKIGDTESSNNYVWIDSDELSIYASGNKVATFTAEQTQLGNLNANGRAVFGGGEHSVTIDNGTVSGERTETNTVTFGGKWEVSVDSAGNLVKRWIGG